MPRSRPSADERAHEDDGALGREVDAVCAHPSFNTAMRALLANNLQLYRGNRLLNLIGYDRGRLIIGILALYLHGTRRADDPGSGLTAQRLKQLCVEQRVCSAGRARAALSLLQLFGYVEWAPGLDRRYKQLAPTPSLVAFVRERWGAMLSATSLVCPAASAAHSALQDDEFLVAFVAAVVEQFRGGARALAFAPELETFAEHNGGLIILASLALAGSAEDSVPPSAPVPLSISELARRFSVSRAHVRRLIADAQVRHLVQRVGDGDEITFTADLARALQRGVAALFVCFALCARGALAERPARSLPQA